MDKAFELLDAIGVAVLWVSVEESFCKTLQRIWKGLRSWLGCFRDLVHQRSCEINRLLAAEEAVHRVLADVAP